MRALPADGIPISTWTSAGEALTEIAREVREDLALLVSGQTGGG